MAGSSILGTNGVLASAPSNVASGGTGGVEGSS